MTPPVFDAAFQARLEALFRWRRDVRHFRPDPVPEAALERLLALAALAPSVGLSQPWRFVLVEDAARRAWLRENFRRSNAEALAAQPAERAARYARLKLAGLEEAPCLLALFALPDPAQGHGLGRRTMPQTLDYSAVMAAHTLWLAARAEGLGLGWVSILEPEGMAAALAVPAEWRFIGLFCLGYPQADSETPELQREGWETPRPAPLLRR
ncbi:5,6-dimethylbenzimidazole synthase [Teichococcus aestuarii]|uniref:5,6-dimethylbenzimidazole synthase n=1 Tax=Teichococcus aestuarii TaxID=568898 RepID=UPI0036110FFE